MNHETNEPESRSDTGAEQSDWMPSVDGPSDSASPDIVSDGPLDDSGDIPGEQHPRRLAGLIRGVRLAPPTPPSWHRLVGRIATVMALLAGLAASSQLLLHWITDGNGSSFDGRGLAGNLMVGRARPSAGPLAGAGILVIAVLGAAVAATSAARSRTIAAVRAAFGLLIAAGLVTAATAGGFTLNKWGSGPVVLSIAGSLSLISGVMLFVVAPRLDGRVGPVWSYLATWALGGTALVLAAGALLTVSSGKEEGWSTPEAAAEAFLESLDSSDLFAALQSVSPLEARGTETALRELETRLREAPTAAESGMSLDLEVSYGTLTGRKLGPGVVAVRSDIELGVNTDGLDGSVTEALLQGRTWNKEDLDIVTVFENGGWWVSPMLTAGKYLSWELGLATGDYEAVRSPAQTGGAATGEISASLELIGEGISRSDPDTIAAGLDPGSQRLVTVFRDAIADLLDGLSNSLDLTVDSLSVELSPDGTATFEALDVSGDGRGFQRAEFGNCDESAAGTGTVCMLDGLPLTTPITLADLPLHVYDDKGQLKLDLLPTAIDWAGQIWSRVDPSYVTLVGRFDTLEGVPAYPLEFGVTQDVNLSDGEIFRRFSLDTQPGRPISITLDSPTAEIWLLDESSDSLNDDAPGFIRFGDPDDGPRSFLYSPTSSSTTVLLVGEQNCNEARLIDCHPIATRASLMARDVPQVTLESDALVSPELDPAELALVTFTVEGDGRYEIATDSPDVEVSIIDLPSASASAIETLNGNIMEFAPGMSVTLAVRNVSDSTQSFGLSVVEAPLPVGFLYSGQSTMEITVNIYSGSTTVPIQFRPGMKLTVLAFPNDGQDITLDGSCTGCDYQDVGFSGDMEDMTFYTGNATESTITIDGYGYFNNYGTVTLVLRIDQGG